MEFRECVPPASNLFVTWKKYSFDFRSCLGNFVKKERKVVRRNSWIREIIHSILFSESSILKFVLKFFFFFFSIPFRNFLIFVDRKHPSSSFPFYSSFSLFLPPSPFFRFVLTDCFTFLSPATILLLSPHHLHSLPSPVQKLRYKFN